MNRVIYTVMLLIMASSCADQPLYGFMDKVVFRHNNPFYEKNCSVIGDVENIVQRDSGYVYLIANVTCSKNQYEFKHIRLYVPEEFIITLVK